MEGMGKNNGGVSKGNPFSPQRWPSPPNRHTTYDICAQRLNTLVVQDVQTVFFSTAVSDAYFQATKL